MSYEKIANIKGPKGDPGIGTRGIVVDMTDLDALRSPDDIGPWSARAAVLTGLPAGMDVSGNPLVNVSIERNATNGVVQRLVTVDESWERAAFDNTQWGEFRRLATSDDLASLEPVVSADPYAPLEDGQTLYVIDPRHGGHDFPVGAPAGFSVPWTSYDAEFTQNDDATILGGTGTRYAGLNFGMLAWDEFAPFSDGDVLARIALATLTSAVSFGVMMRASGPDGTAKTGYFCFVSLTGGTPTLVLASYEDNSYTRIGSAEFDVAAKQPFMMRVRAEGTQIHAKAWLEGTPEPEAWMISVTSAVASSGWVGLMQGGGARGVANYLAVNTSGGPA